MRRSLRAARRALSTRWRSAVARSRLSEMPHESATRAAVLVTKAPQSMHIPFHAVGCVQCLVPLGVVLAMAGGKGWEGKDLRWRAQSKSRKDLFIWLFVFFDCLSVCVL